MLRLSHVQGVDDNLPSGSHCAPFFSSRGHVWSPEVITWGALLTTLSLLLHVGHSFFKSTDCDRTVIYAGLILTFHNFSALRNFTGKKRGPPGACQWSAFPSLARYGGVSLAASTAALKPVERIPLMFPRVPLPPVLFPFSPSMFCSVLVPCTAGPTPPPPL